MTIKTKGSISLAVFILFFSVGVVFPQLCIAQISVFGFNPSVGWAAAEGDQESGTLVRILGKGFDANPKNHEVRFSDASGEPSSNIIAPVKATFPAGLEYEFERAFGSPGSASGEFGSKIGPIAIYEKTGEVFVVDTDNRRVEVFDRNGDFSRHVGVGLLNILRGIAVGHDGKIYVSGKHYLVGEGIAVFNSSGTLPLEAFIGGLGVLNQPNEIAVDDRGWVYVLDYPTPPAPNEFARLVMFDAQGEKLGSFSGIDEDWGQILNIAVDPHREYPLAPTTFYISDGSSKVVYKYDTDVPLLDKWEFPEADPIVGRVAVDGDGFVYVDLGNRGIVKVDSSGNLIATVLPNMGVTQPFRTVDKNGEIYIAEDGEYTNGCNCVKVFSPKDKEELLVHVPFGAKTGPITVIHLTDTGGQSDTSFNDFNVLERLDNVRVANIEATQGLASYPFIAGKETLIWASIVGGVFGHPTKDQIIAKITTPTNEVLTLQKTDIHSFPDVRNKRTIVHLHIPKIEILNPGQYRFEVTFKRDGSELSSSGIPLPWIKTIDFYDTDGPDLLFVKFSDIPNDQWNLQDPFDWFDMTGFLRGIETFVRVFPVNSQTVVTNFVTGKYVDFIVDGVIEAEEAKLMGEVTTAIKEFNETWSDGFDKAVGLVDPNISRPANGWAGGETAVVYFDAGAGTFGRTLAHEIGHLYGLVKRDKPNLDPDDEQQQPHSINQTLENEDDAPLKAWNPITDKLIPDLNALPIMQVKLPAPDYSSFFESKFMGEKVDYHILCEQLASDGCSDTSSSSSTRALITKQNVEIDAQIQKFVLLGSIDSGNAITITNSYLTTADLPLTPIEESEYSLVFLDEFGAILAQDRFLPDLVVEQGGVDQVDVRIFDLTRPYPVGTASVEIRLGDTELSTLTPSENAPVISEVTVETREMQPVEIRWTAMDPDGDPLRYTVLYSSDGGGSFTPIGVGLTETRLLWDDRLTGGSSDALIKIIANDGFYRNTLLSNHFVLPKKQPQVVILTPTDGAIFTEGSVINVRGAGFDPEDRSLPGANLKWQLDDDIGLGIGENLTVYETPRQAAVGFVMLPLEVGIHTLQLETTDTDGNTASAAIVFEIVTDTDRDGASDQDETDSGTDPNDPFVRPNQPPVSRCLDITVSTEPGVCSAEASVNAGSYDPDEDLIIIDQSPSGPYELGNTEVTLEITDDKDAASECDAMVTVVDQEPPVLTCPTILVAECTGPDGAPVSFNATAVDNCTEDPSLSCDPSPGSVFPFGLTPTSCSAIDESGNLDSCNFTVTVEDTTDPVISSLSAIPNALWPPNHKMKSVTVEVESLDICDPNPVCQIILVSSNEPVNGLGDGDTAPDWEITGDLTVNLRAERSGTGSGRIYTITIQCTDDNGNSSAGDTTVTVPHDSGKKSKK